MSTQQLFYKDVAPVNKERHANWGILDTKDYRFARTINSIPLTAVEFPQAAKDFAIVFAKTAETYVPVAVMGVRNEQNLYVNSEGQWTASYVPAFVRRYPFIFSTVDEGKTLTLCLDEAFEGCSQEGKGERLFDEAGEKSPYLEKVMSFLQEYQTHSTRTELFCKKLDELALLEPMNAQFKTPGGQNGTLNGFFVVNRDKLKALSAEQVVDLVKTDEMEIIYLHINSMANLRETIKLLPEFDAA